jgi:ketosteroid isomerase-like protein
MFSWLARRLLSHNLARLNADDVRFSFPGDSSWSGEFRGKSELRPWLERMVAIGIQHRADEVVLQGFPWRQTICLRGEDHLDDPGEGRVYENRYVIWGTIRWGRLVEYEVYEDTQRAKALDGWLDRRAQAVAS